MKRDHLDIKEKREVVSKIAQICVAFNEILCDENNTKQIWNKIEHV